MAVAGSARHWRFKQIDVLTNVPLPIEVDEAVRWRDIEPHPLAVLAARGFALVEEGHGLAAFAAALAPDLWETANAFRVWKCRCADLTISDAYKKLPISVRIPISVRNSERWPAYRVRRAGARYAQTVRIDPELHPDPRAAMTALLSELETFEAVAALPSPRPEPSDWASTPPVEGPFDGPVPACPAASSVPAQLVPRVFRVHAVRDSTHASPPRKRATSVVCDLAAPPVLTLAEFFPQHLRPPTGLVEVPPGLRFARRPRGQGAAAIDELEDLTA